MNEIRKIKKMLKPLASDYITTKTFEAIERYVIKARIEELKWSLQAYEVNEINDRIAQLNKELRAVEDK